MRAEKGGCICEGTFHHKKWVFKQVSPAPLSHHIVFSCMCSVLPLIFRWISFSFIYGPKLRMSVTIFRQNPLLQMRWRSARGSLRCRPTGDVIQPGSLFFITASRKPDKLKLLQQQGERRWNVPSDPPSALRLQTWNYSTHWWALQSCSLLFPGGSASSGGKFPASMFEGIPAEERFVSKTESAGGELPAARSQNKTASSLSLGNNSDTLLW